MENRETLYARLYQLGDHLRDGLRDSFKKAGLPALIGGLGPVVQVSLTETTILRDYRDWIRRDTTTYQRLVEQLVPLGVRTITRGTWYLSTAHAEEDIQSTLERVDSVLKQRG
jgi:glutamate-1-semialdehyde aminotransferase